MNQCVNERKVRKGRRQEWSQNHVSSKTKSPKNALLLDSALIFCIFQRAVGAFHKPVSLYCRRGWRNLIKAPTGHQPGICCVLQGLLSKQGHKQDKNNLFCLRAEGIKLELLEVVSSQMNAPWSKEPSNRRTSHNQITKPLIICPHFYFSRSENDWNCVIVRAQMFVSLSNTDVLSCVGNQLFCQR